MEWTPITPTSSRVHIIKHRFYVGYSRKPNYPNVWNLEQNDKIILFINRGFNYEFIKRKLKRSVLSTALDSTYVEPKSNLTTGTIHRKYTYTKNAQSRHTSEQRVNIWINSRIGFVPISFLNENIP